MHWSLLGLYTAERESYVKLTMSMHTHIPWLDFPRREILLGDKGPVMASVPGKDGGCKDRL